MHGDIERTQQDRIPSKYGCDRMVCLGDIVEGEPFDGETIEPLRGEKVECVRGNHDCWATSVTLNYAFERPSALDKASTVRAEVGGVARAPRRRFTWDRPDKLTGTRMRPRCSTKRRARLRGDAASANAKRGTALANSAFSLVVARGVTRVGVRIGPR